MPLIFYNYWRLFSFWDDVVVAAQSSTTMTASSSLVIIYSSVHLWHLPELPPNICLHAPLPQDRQGMFDRSAENATTSHQQCFHRLHLLFFLVLKQRRWCLQPDSHATIFYSGRNSFNDFAHAHQQQITNEQSTNIFYCLPASPRICVLQGQRFLNFPLPDCRPRSNF